MIEGKCCGMFQQINIEVHQCQHNPYFCDRLVADCFTLNQMFGSKLSHCSLWMGASVSIV